ncbi:MAG: hypothetical protein F6K19_16260 [Cyanothece sp. SIO1E1]|nr:hypothetical protein [Cyanothece sp. SIO1E1]
MSTADPYQVQDIQRLQTLFCLVPIVGFFPALWTLYRKQGSQRQRATSRLAVTLALGWLVSYLLLASSAQISESWSLSFLITSSLITSGYFLGNIWLMVRLFRRKRIY